MKKEEAYIYDPSKRRKNIKSPNWSHLLTCYRVTSAVIKCVDVTEVERAVLLYIHIRTEATAARSRAEKPDTDCPVGVSGLTLRRFSILQSFEAAANGHVN